MLETVLFIPFWFELTATITSAISGAMSASSAKYDLLGTVVLATIVGLMGGVMRDVMLQDYGIYAFQRPSLIIACMACGIIVFYFGRLVSYLGFVSEVVDTVTVGMWCIVGTGKALSAGLGIAPAVIMGLLTSIGGGIVRDVLINRPVIVFQPGSYYGSAAMVGSIVFSLMWTYHILDAWSAIICMLLVIAIRIVSVVFGFHTRPSRDLTVPMADALAKPVRALKGRDRLAELTHDGHVTEMPPMEMPHTPSNASRALSKRLHGKNADKLRRRFKL